MGGIAALLEQNGMIRRGYGCAGGEQRAGIGYP